MGFWRGKKLGDTLVEVTIAIGIFSLVAIAVVSVVSNSTSSAQANLENTVTREEIDAQAEAIRFIHDSYVMDTAETPVYKEIWDHIASKAVVTKDEKALAGIENYMPTSCDAPFKFKYDGKDYDYTNNIFVVNYNAIGSLNKDNIVKTSYEAPLSFPRIRYTTGTDSLSGENNLDGSFAAAEGIFVLAVKDPNSTYTSEGGEVVKGAAYYDFYIRTCWFAANSNTPTTISTVIRLADPSDEREGDRGFDATASLAYHQTTKSGPGQRRDDTTDVISGHTKTLLTDGFNRDNSTLGWHFEGWCYDRNGVKGSQTVTFPSANPGDNKTTNCNGDEYSAGGSFQIPISVSRDNKYHFYEILRQNPPFTILYDANRENNGNVCKTWNTATDCRKSGDKVNGGEPYNKTIWTNARRSSGYTIFSGANDTYHFVGWCTAKLPLITNGANPRDLCKKTANSPAWLTSYYYAGGENGLQASSNTPTSGGELVLYAIWEVRPITITYKPGDHATGTTKPFTEYAHADQKAKHSIKTYQELGYRPETCYKFTGWKSNTGTIYQPGTVINQSMTLTAQWDYNCYKVIYHPNGGTGSPVSFDVMVGVFHTVQENKWFAFSGRKFTGWNTNPSGGSDHKTPSYSQVIGNPRATINLYAEWTQECKLGDQHFGEITIANQTNHYDQIRAPGTSEWQNPGIYAWTVPNGCGGKYQLEVWGARGESKGGGSTGGAGGFATGYTNLVDGQTIYVVIGNGGDADRGKEKGWNGGGVGGWGVGGGATHIAVTKWGDGQLKNYAQHQGEVLIVAGGGGAGVKFSDHTEWTCPGGNYAGDTHHVEALKPGGAYANGGKGGGANGGDGNNPNANSLYPFGTPNGSGLRPDCYKWTFVGDGWNTSWGDDGSLAEPAHVDGCGEVFLYNAMGGKPNAGGRGGWGTDHYDPYITDENNNPLYGAMAACDENGQNCNFIAYNNDNRAGVNNHAHDNIIGGMGKFGEGGSSYKMIYVHKACERSDHVKNQLGRTCNLFNSNKASYQYILDPYGVSIDHYWPGSVSDTGMSGGGGGGGWYGGGAGGTTGCRPASGAGGSGHFGSISNYSYGNSETTNYGSAVIRRITN